MKSLRSVVFSQSGVGAIPAIRATPSEMLTTINLGHSIWCEIQEFRTARKRLMWRDFLSIPPLVPNMAALRHQSKFSQELRR
jgi:hypothetical protein